MNQQMFAHRGNLSYLQQFCFQKIRAIEKCKIGKINDDFENMESYSKRNKHTIEWMIKVFVKINSKFI